MNDHDKFCRDWLAGMTTNAMADKYGIARSTVSERAKKYGLMRRRPRHDDGTGFRVVGTRRPGRSYALTGGEWVYDNVRRVQVWRFNS